MILSSHSVPIILNLISYRFLPFFLLLVSSFNSLSYLQEARSETYTMYIWLVQKKERGETDEDCPACREHTSAHVKSQFPLDIMIKPSAGRSFRLRSSYCLGHSQFTLDIKIRPRAGLRFIPWIFSQKLNQKNHWGHKKLPTLIFLSRLLLISARRQLWMIRKLFQVIAQIVSSHQLSSLYTEPKTSAEEPLLKAVSSFPSPVEALPRGSELPKIHAKVSCFSLPVCPPPPPWTTFSSYRCSDECPICLNLLEERDAEQWPTCSHKFHSRCLQQWRNNPSATCPSCRASDDAVHQVSFFHYPPCRTFSSYVQLYCIFGGDGKPRFCDYCGDTLDEGNVKLWPRCGHKYHPTCFEWLHSPFPQRPSRCADVKNHVNFSGHVQGNSNRNQITLCFQKKRFGFSDLKV
ncbi:hypothetical protein VP01_2246g1 [Puccinia sorghi]|uniref:RING-type domain-containing protein n=1 Tax=Puccinia sorghi TaxID=27349 RepID=A0A0L6V8I5_9BASI|nr:hypothetical protein VP01_2246g1 [Puccinia sorghi]